MECILLILCFSYAKKHKYFVYLTCKFVAYEPASLTSTVHVSRPLGHFLVNLCAIIGGIYTVASIIDGILYHSYRAIQQKIEIGKLS